MLVSIKTALSQNNETEKIHEKCKQTEHINEKMTGFPQNIS